MNAAGITQQKLCPPFDMKDYFKASVSQDGRRLLLLLLLVGSLLNSGVCFSIVSNFFLFHSYTESKY
jgi:hypothetical protein